MTKLYLIRHGQTDYSRDKKYCGSRDVPLNAEGMLQAEKLARRFSHVAVDAVYASDLRRAIQTAGICFKESRVIVWPSFREMDFGVLEGLGYEDAMKNFPAIYDAWIHTPLDVTLPQGESFGHFCERVDDGMKLLLAENKGKSIALITHGGPIRVILCHALGRGVKDFWSIKQDNAALNMIEYHEGRAAEVVSINDTEHLTRSEDI